MVSCEPVNMAKKQKQDRICFVQVSVVDLKIKMLMDTIIREKIAAVPESQKKGRMKCTALIAIREVSWPNGMASNIFFSKSAPSLEVISDAMNPGATAFTC